MNFLDHHLVVNFLSIRLGKYIGIEVLALHEPVHQDSPFHTALFFLEYDTENKSFSYEFFFADLIGEMLK